MPEDWEETYSEILRLECILDMDTRNLHLYRGTDREEIQSEINKTKIQIKEMTKELLDGN